MPRERSRLQAQLATPSLALAVAMAATGCLSVDDSKPSKDAGGVDVGVIDEAGWIPGVHVDAGADASSDPCTTCIAAKCNPEAVTCLNSPECKKILDCAATCTESSCYTTCASAHPSGAGAFNALAVCAINNCATEC